MSVQVLTPAPSTRLTTPARVKADLNIGTPDLSQRLVALQPLTNGALPLAVQPATPSSVTARIVDPNGGLVAGTVTFAGSSPTGLPVSEVWTVTHTALTFVGTQVFAAFTSIIAAGCTVLSGDETIEVGVGTATTDDDLVGRLIDAASRAISAYCANRVWGVEKVVELVTGSGARFLRLTRAPLITIDTLTEDDAAITDYRIEDAGLGALYREVGWAPARAGGWDSVAYGGGMAWYGEGYIIPSLARLRYSATYTAGFDLPNDIPVAGHPALPADVEHACLETAKAWYHQSPGRDPFVIQKRVGDQAISYIHSDAALALPPVAAGLLAQWRTRPL